MANKIPQVTRHLLAAAECALEKSARHHAEPAARVANQVLHVKVQEKNLKLMLVAFNSSLNLLL
jgi:hypothetical protein